MILQSCEEYKIDVLIRKINRLYRLCPLSRLKPLTRSAIRQAPASVQLARVRQTVVKKQYYRK
jgi:hypothetical protein